MKRKRRKRRRRQDGEPARGACATNFTHGITVVHVIRTTHPLYTESGPVHPSNHHPRLAAEITIATSDERTQSPNRQLPVATPLVVLEIEGTPRAVATKTGLTLPSHSRDDENYIGIANERESIIRCIQ